MKKTLKIILPVFNEEESILPLKRELVKLEKIIKKEYKVIYVWINDGSTDNSEKILNKIKNKQNLVFHFINNFGKTNAIIAGISKSSSNFTAILDTDLQDNPLYIKRMLSKINKDKVDFVIGNRVNRYDNNFLKKTSSFFVKFIIKQFFQKLNINDVNCGIKVMTNQLASNLYLKSDYHRYLPLIAHLKRFKVAEINIIQRKRKYGESKYGITGFKRSWKSFSDLLNIIFILKISTNPFSFFGKIGVFSTLIGLTILSYVSMLWFVGEPINSRPLFFLGILAVTTGINFLSLGLIGDLIKINNSSKEYLIKE